jgi:hypothetical protein
MTGNQQQERIGDEMLSMVRCDGFQKIRKDVHGQKRFSIFLRKEDSVVTTCRYPFQHSTTIFSTAADSFNVDYSL